MQKNSWQPSWAPRQFSQNRKFVFSENYFALIGPCFTNMASRKDELACSFLKASYANECLCKCCFVLIYWTVWPCKQLGGKDNRWALLSLICLVHCAVCHTLAHFGITWERTKSKAEIRFPLSSLLMTMNFLFFAFGFNTFTSVIKLLR